MYEAPFHAARRIAVGAPSAAHPGGRRVRRVGCLVSLLVVLAAWSACGVRAPYIWVQELPPAYFASPPVEVIERGELINIRVFGQDNLSAPARVRLDGTIVMPLVGEVVAVDKRPADLAKEIEEKLKPYVTTPNVTIFIQESQVHIDVIGEVGKKGALVLERPATVLSALANAGGLTDFASHSRVFVLRPDASGRLLRIRFRYDALIQGEPSATAFRLRSGDTIVVE